MKYNASYRLWEKIRDELRKHRGQNRFRGREEHIIPKKLVRLPVEARGAKPAQGWIDIHLTDAESDLWAKARPAGETWHLKDFRLDLEAFIGFLVDQCRGDAYLHTNSKTADYRNKYRQKESEKDGGKKDGK